MKIEVNGLRRQDMELTDAIPIIHPLPLKQARTSMDPRRKYMNDIIA